MREARTDGRISPRPPEHPRVGESNRCCPGQTQPSYGQAERRATKHYLCGVPGCLGDEVLLTGHGNSPQNKHGWGAPAPFICRGCAQLWVRSNPTQHPLSPRVQVRLRYQVPEPSMLQDLPAHEALVTLMSFFILLL